MPKFKIQDLRSLEGAANTPALLKNKVGEMLLNSTAVRARVESINDDTGEYRLVLQGTLQHDPKLD